MTCLQIFIHGCQAKLLSLGRLLVQCTLCQPLLASACKILSKMLMRITLLQNISEDEVEDADDGSSTRKCWRKCQRCQWGPLLKILMMPKILMARWGCRKGVSPLNSSPRRLCLLQAMKEALLLLRVSHP
jgi:hypothetical protein